jgi:hypothetical protein
MAFASFVAQRPSATEVQAVIKTEMYYYRLLLTVSTAFSETLAEAPSSVVISFVVGRKLESFSI